MLRGIFTAATGMNHELNRQEVIANNLANVETVGFKRDNVVSLPFHEMLLNSYSKEGVQSIGKLGLGVQTTTTFVDFSDATTIESGNPLDLAIKGPGVFATEGPRGVRYTRAGNFAISSDGYLVTKEGYKVLGKNGPVKVSGGLEITTQGEIIKNGEVVDELAVYDPAGLNKEGQYSYVADGDTAAIPAQNYQIIQGSLETSNVNAIREMIQMITIGRNYESNQKAMTIQDETLGKAVNELAK